MAEAARSDTLSDTLCKKEPHGILVLQAEYNYMCITQDRDCDEVQE